MSDDNILRQEVRQSLYNVRRLIRSYSGLYAGEDLARDVLKACDEMAGQSTPRLREALRTVQERCTKLVRDADRFSARDPATIAASRAQAFASIDILQDALFEMRKAETSNPRLGALLRRKSL
ncbi:hypothetical protein [Microvirga guangxiensis]|uniref:Uncharacterized protein n=1 Tax=Microvirga guangxiensis TaxID=549386 RepID=A0A1G5IAH1_9HYPH|nr:hypothetical protein [Microvirga guangxiensis]SCY72994.1 hypothetical protein SAMN02927923_02171 [Microvirga guangxiensis]